MPALSAVADILDKAADQLEDPAITSEELAARGLPGQSGAEKKLLTRTRDQVGKFDHNDDLRVDVEIIVDQLLRLPPLRADLSADLLSLQRKHYASQLRPQANELRGFVAARQKKAKELRRLRKLKLQQPHTPRRNKSKAPVFDATTGKLTLNGKPLSLSSGEKFVLRRLVERRTATFAELQSEHPRPDRVLKRLREKYPALKRFISLPGGPGKGGYSTTIESGGAD